MYAPTIFSFSRLCRLKLLGRRCADLWSLRITNYGKRQVGSVGLKRRKRKKSGGTAAPKFRFTACLTAFLTSDVLRIPTGPR